MEWRLVDGPKSAKMAPDKHLVMDACTALQVEKVVAAVVERRWMGISEYR